MTADHSPTSDRGGPAPFRPQGAVYISTAGVDVNHARRFAADLNSAGVAVFLDEVDDLNGEEGEARILRAVNAADNVLVLLTPTTGSSLYPASSGSLDRRYVWLAIGAAFARGIRIIGLLDRLSRDELAADATIPNIVRLRELLDSENLQPYVQEFRAPDSSRLRSPTGAGNIVRMCFAEEDREAVGRIREHLLTNYQIESFDDVWGGDPAKHSAGANQALTHAVAVFLGRGGFPARDGDGHGTLLGRYASSGRPIIVVGLPSFVGFPTVPEYVRGREVWIDCRRTEEFPHLQFLWAVCGYRVNHRPEPVGTSDRTVLRVALHGYDQKAASSPAGNDPRAHDRLREMIHAEVTGAIKSCGLRVDQTVAVQTSDGAILLLDSPDTAHHVAAALAERGRTKTTRRFRMGAATGQVSLEPRNDGGDLGLFGPAVGHAIQLETAGAPCTLLVDPLTHDQLPLSLRPAYTEDRVSAGPNRTRIPAWRCVFVKVNLPTVPSPTRRRSQQRRDVLERITALRPETALEELILLLAMPIERQPSKYLTHAERCMVVLTWITSGGRERMQALTDNLDYLETRHR